MKTQKTILNMLALGSIFAAVAPAMAMDEFENFASTASTITASTMAMADNIAPRQGLVAQMITMGTNFAFENPKTAIGATVIAAVFLYKLYKRATNRSISRDKFFNGGEHVTSEEAARRLALGDDADISYTLTGDDAIKAIKDMDKTLNDSK